MDLYGPPLPPGYIKPVDDDDDSNCEDSSPSVSDKNAGSKQIGPYCPDFLLVKDVSNEKDSSENITIGPQLPENLRNNQAQDECIQNDIGPALTDFGTEYNDSREIKAEIEKRAEKMKNKLNNKDVPVEVNQREEWMTVPDTSRRNQLGAISRCLAPSKSPSENKRSHTHHQIEKDKKTSEELKKYNKSRRSESLMDTHTKKLKKKEKEKSSKKKERKAFDRDEVAVRNFTKEQVNSVIDKAKYLNSRFAPGNNQYL